MDTFFAWYTSAKSTLHPVEIAAHIHADFVNIHPFIDGNGRTARLIMNLELMKAGFPTVIIPVEERPAYYQNLDTAATAGEYMPFIVQIGKMTEQNFNIYWKLL